MNAAPARRPIRHHAPRLAALAALFGAWLALVASPALAREGHEFESSFGAAGSEAGQLQEPRDVAVDNSTGNVYVADTGNHRVDEFSSTGAFIRAWGWGVADGTTNALQTCTSTCFAGISGSGAGQFNTPKFIAVDNSSGGGGDLYVADTATNLVQKFGPSGNLITAWGGTPAAGQQDGSGFSEGPFAPLGGIAVDAAGNLDVFKTTASRVFKLAQAGSLIETFSLSTSSAGPGFAVDSAGDFFKAGSTFGVPFNVEKYDSAHNDLGRPFSGIPTGFDVASSTNDLYVDKGGSSLERFHFTAANQVLQADGSSCEFSSSTSCAATESFGSSQLSGSGGAGLAINSAAGTASPAGDVYVAGATANKVYVFSGLIVVPDVATDPPSDVTPTTATLHGHLDPDAAHGGGEVTSCQFKYGLTEAYGETAPCAPAPSYSGPEDVSAAIEHLQQAATYHFRLEAANANGVPSTGEDETFTTPGPPTVDHQAAEALGSTARFVAYINPWGLDTTCQLQYVEEEQFQASEWANATAVSCSPADLGQGFGDVKTKFKVTGLAPHTTYDYRFLATNQAGPSGGAGSTFETYGIREYAFNDLKSSRAGHYKIPGSPPREWEEWQPGESETQAGAHPDELVTTIELSRTTFLTQDPYTSSESEYENLTLVNTKDIKVELPPGLIGNPNALPKCNRYLVNKEQCPGQSQVGKVEVWGDSEGQLFEGSFFAPRPPEWSTPLYNLEPSGRYPAEFGTFFEGQVGGWIPFHLRTGGDYGVDADSINIPALAVPAKVRVTVWGVPADPAHEAERYCPGPGGRIAPPCPDHEPEKPLLRNPTSCAGPQTSTAAVDSWQEQGVFSKATTELSGFTGCNALQFEPTLEALPTTNVADSPSGLHVDLHVPQDLNSEGFEDPHGTATADLKDAKVVLPQGLVVNPASANGLAACSSAQIELHGPNAPTCPDASKIGTVEVDTPLIDHPLPGAVYVATPHDNPFGSLLAIYIVVNDPETGVIVKLAGHIEADPQTGQLTTTTDETPQLPFEDFKLDFFGGAKAALRTPATCGSYESQSVLKPWSWPESGEPVEGTSPFQITQAPAAAGGKCPATASQEPSAPSFEAGTETPTAGHYSPFILHLHREDGSQELTTLNTTLPPGLVGKLAGVAECSEGAIAAAKAKSGIEEQASPSCPAASQVGTVNVASGAGPAPYWVQGHAYLAGPYKGAPLSLAIVTPAVAGPYDLGTVVVRAALYVNPETTQITVRSDPIPTILQGIPLDVRTIAVKMDRPQFTLNPTSCEKMSVAGEVMSAFGLNTPLSNPFQVGGCKSLAFKPKLSLRLKGSTKRAGTPALTATLTMPPGGANIGKAQVTLPHSEFLDNAHIKTICTRVQFAEGSVPGEKCPPGSVYGHARAITPLLDQPLEGPVYLRSSSHKLPDLVAALNGQIQVVLDGRIDSVHGGIRNTFEVVPDAPVSKFVLSMQGGKKGLLENSTNICATPQHANVQFVAQNGKIAQLAPKLKVRCPRSGKGHGKHRHH